MAVNVDDIHLAGSNERLAAVKQTLLQQFQMKDMGELHYFLGVKVILDHKTGSVWIGQQSYTENIQKDSVWKMPIRFELQWMLVQS